MQNFRLQAYNQPPFPDLSSFQNQALIPSLNYGYLPPAPDFRVPQNLKQEETTNSSVTQLSASLNVIQALLQNQSNVLAELCQKKNTESEIQENHDDRQENEVEKKLLRELEIRKKIQKNEAKNIPKNIIKAMVKYTQKKDFDNSSLKCDSWDLFSKELTQIKKKVFSLNQLKQAWANNAFSDPEYARIFRLHSNFFIKRDYVSYLFNSKIENTKIHLKARHKLLKAIQTPTN